MVSIDCLKRFPLKRCGPHESFIKTSVVLGFLPQQLTNLIKITRKITYPLRPFAHFSLQNVYLSTPSFECSLHASPLEKNNRMGGNSLFSTHGS